MGALSKSFSPFYKAVTTFFSMVLPEVLRFLVLSLFVLWASYRRQSSEYEYMAMLNKRSSRFVYRRKLRPGLDECPICLSEFMDGDVCRDLQQCRHVFHKNCLEKWLHGSRATCPLCRKPVLPEEIVLQHKSLQNDHPLTTNIQEELALILLSSVHGWSCHGFF